MKRMFTSLISIILITSALGACTNREMGTAGGAVVGGLAGSALTGGSPIGTVAGAVGGGYIGHELSR